MTDDDLWKADGETMKGIRAVNQMADAVKSEGSSERADLVAGEMAVEAYKTLQVDDEDKLASICEKHLKRSPGEYRFLLKFFDGNEARAAARVVKHMRDCRDRLPVQSQWNNADMGRQIRFLDSLCHKKIVLRGGSDGK